MKIKKSDVIITKTKVTKLKMNTKNPSSNIPLLKSLNFSNKSKIIRFFKNGYPLDFHSCFTHRLMHLQAMLRLPDYDGRRYYMGTYSQSVADDGSEGGMVFVGEWDGTSNYGMIIWCDILNNNHLGGGFNHPGDLRLLDNVVVIAGQNWNNKDYPGCKKMHRGDGGQYVLFYDVSKPNSPTYIGKLNSCWDGDKEIKISGEIDEVSVSKSGDYYYLSFNGIKCKSTSLSPDIKWELIQTGSDTYCDPAYFNYEGALYFGGASVSGRYVFFNRFEFTPGHNILINDTHSSVRENLMTAELPWPNLAEGYTNVLSSFASGKSSVVRADVECDEYIRIEEIESIEEVTAITDLYILFGKNSPCPTGYIKVPVDLNRDAGGDDIYLCYSRMPSQKKPITGVEILINNKKLPENYEWVNNSINKGKGPCDLNKDAGGDDVYMTVCRKDKDQPLTRASINIGKSTKANPGWIQIQKDLNSGAGGNFLYFTYSLH